MEAQQTFIDENGNINLDRLSKELQSALDFDLRYKQTDNMKKRAVKVSTSYDEFKAMVACAHLKKLTKKEVESLSNVKKGWIKKPSHEGAESVPSVLVEEQKLEETKKNDEKFIKKATLAEVKSWVERAEGVISMITIAPELQDQEVIDYLHAQGIILSSGHSNATYEQGKGFLNKPIPAVTHLFNAMPQMHHREPGYIPAIFEERPYTSIVADGNHVDWPMIRLAKRELGDKLFLITDAVTAATEGAYQHRLEGDKYVMPDGTLSGSSLTMLKAVQNCIEKVGIGLAEAVNMASLYPAQLAKKETKGSIRAGFDADLIIFNAHFEAVATILQGNYLTITT
ncbi:hypothetical protein EON65_30775 [archaeon]|nr:MAG: hypothetical protein EON65_30775 [archaeon]